MHLSVTPHSDPWSTSYCYPHRTKEGLRSEKLNRAILWPRRLQSLHLQADLCPPWAALLFWRSAFKGIWSLPMSFPSMTGDYLKAVVFAHVLKVSMLMRPLNLFRLLGYHIRVLNFLGNLENRLLRSTPQFPLVWSSYSWMLPFLLLTRGPSNTPRLRTVLSFSSWCSPPLLWFFALSSDKLPALPPRHPSCRYSLLLCSDDPSFEVPKIWLLGKMLFGRCQLLIILETTFFLEYCIWTVVTVATFDSPTDQCGESDEGLNGCFQALPIDWVLAPHYPSCTGGEPLLFLILLMFLSRVANRSSSLCIGSLSCFSSKSFSYFHGSHTFFLPPATNFCLFSSSPSLLQSPSEPKLGFPKNRHQLPALVSRKVSQRLFYKTLVLRDSHE